MFLTGCSIAKSPDLKLQTHKEQDDFCRNFKLSNKYNPEVEGNPSEGFEYYSDLSNFVYIEGEKGSSNLQEESEKQSVFDNAYTAGNSFGRYSAKKEIWEKVIQPNGLSLGQIFNYDELLYANRVMPMKLFFSSGGKVKGNGVLIENGTELKVSGEFKVINNTTGWRSFLSMPSSKVPEINYAVSKLTKNLKSSWQKGFSSGYERGVCFAYQDYVKSLERLKEDYYARLMYVRGEKHGLVPPPKIRKVDGVMIKKDDGRRYILNQTIYKVEQPEEHYQPLSNWGEIQE